MGWRGLLAGVVPAAVAALRSRHVAAAVGPGIGSCCYDVGEEVAGPVRRAYGPAWCATAGSTYPGRSSGRSAAPAASASTVSTSARRAIPSGTSRTGATRGEPGVRGRSPTSPEEVRERYERVQADVGPGVTVVAATKYVPLGEMGVLAEAGIPVVGENRAQDLTEKHEAFGDAFRWHFIGHLQSRKAGTVNATCALVHSLDSESAARRVEIPALVQVNLAGEQTKSGIPPEALEQFLSTSPAAVVGLSTMPPLADDPEASRPYFRRLRALAETYGLAQLSMGTTQDYLVAAQEGATLVRVGAALFQG